MRGEKQNHEKEKMDHYCSRCYHRICHYRCQRKQRRKRQQTDNSVTKVENTAPPATAAPDTSSEDSTDSEAESDAPLIFKEGETASKNGIEITMTKVTESKGKGYNKPAKGKIFVICNFLVENKSDDDFTMSMLDYNAYADGYSLSETYYSEDDFGSLLLTALYKKNWVCQIEPAKVLRFLRFQFFQSFFEIYF